MTEFLTLQLLLTQLSCLYPSRWVLPISCLLPTLPEKSEQAAGEVPGQGQPTSLPRRIFPLFRPNSRFFHSLGNKHGGGCRETVGDPPRGSPHHCSEPPPIRASFFFFCTFYTQPPVHTCSTSDSARQGTGCRSLAQSFPLVLSCPAVSHPHDTRLLLTQVTRPDSPSSAS